ncbi:hypothetical protein V6Z12_D06G072200 [Gossypium hirsutum]
MGRFAGQVSMEHVVLSNLGGILGELCTYWTRAWVACGARGTSC